MNPYKKDLNMSTLLIYLIVMKMIYKFRYFLRLDTNLFNLEIRLFEIKLSSI